MIYKPVYRLKALDQLKEAVIWYESQQEGLGMKFAEYLEEKMNYLCQYAESYPVVKEHLREFIIRRYPYKIIYRLQKRKKVILITAVFHTSRNPARKYGK